MRWIEPKYSKTQVAKAGKQLFAITAIDKDDQDKFNTILKALTIFTNWRAAHAFPMQIMLDLLRKNAIRVDSKAIAVQRLKRISSIFNKLLREKNMSLSRMEDIGGCRVVVSNTKQVYVIYEKMKKSKSKNILYRVRDYIKEPKESGYRGLHLIYKYNGSKNKYLGLPVELQIRSKIQHSWATAVEVVGAFTKEALKASDGDSFWLDYFTYASVEFTKLEGYEPSIQMKDVDTYDKLNVLSAYLDVNAKLRTFNLAVHTVTNDKEKNAGYYILLLDLKTYFVTIERYKKSQLLEATKFYDDQEAKYKDDTDKNLVMVSAKSLNDLKKAYPNYFLDTVEFSKNIEKVHKKYNDADVRSA